MEETNLKYELAKRVFGQLGAVPDMKEGIGAIIEGAIIPRHLSVRDREDDTIQEIPLYVVRNSRDERLILANLGSDSEPEMILVAENEQVILGLYFEWDSDTKNCGFWTWDSVRETWIPLSMQHILMLTAAFEDITQSGVQWEPYSAWQPMYDWMIKLADFVVEVG
jgi:hypothetical protein